MTRPRSWEEWLWTVATARLTVTSALLERKSESLSACQDRHGASSDLGVAH
jgi:hypothetical protein